MKFPRRVKKQLLIIGGILIIIPTLLIIFISPITKYLVEKYSVKYTGRQVKMNWAYINPFTGYIHFNHLKIYEAKSDSIFFSADAISVSFAIRKIISKTYEITDVSIDNPRGTVILNGKDNFNFTDLILRFAKKDTTPIAQQANKPVVQFNILNVKINNGVFYFHDTLAHVHYFIKNVNFESPGKYWNEDTLGTKFSFSAGTGTGEMNGNFTINLNTLDYRYVVIAHKYNLSIIQQYLKDIINYGVFSANLDANLQSSGNFNNEENQDTKGRIQINDFHFGKTPDDNYLSFDKFVFAMNEVNPEKHLYSLDSIVLTHPYFKYEKYDYLDNIQTMFGKNGGNVTSVDADPKQFNIIIELAHYLIDLSKNFFKSEYKINKLAINKGDIKFNDYSQSEEFSVDANPLYIAADSINQRKGRIKFFIKSGIKPYGNISVLASINPRDSIDFDVDFHFGKIPIALFNPYLIAYTSFPMDRGTVEFTGLWKVRNGIIQSENHLLIIDPRETKRLKNKANHWIPMWLVIYFIRDRGNVIDYQIPVTGNLNTPTFHLHDVLFSTLHNIFVKPLTTPYRTDVKTQESIIEKSFTLQWAMRQSSIQPAEEKFMDKLAKYLAENPNSSITITPQQYETKEKEYILFFEAKKKYYLSLNSQKVGGRWSIADSLYVDKISVKDSLFNEYLNKHLTQSLVFTVQGKCSNLISTVLINTQFNKLNKTRENDFLSYFKVEGVIKRIMFAPAQNIIPYNGFSFYKITYKGELPDYLLKAYGKMNRLNNESPREKYKKDRKKINLTVTKK